MRLILLAGTPLLLAPAVSAQPMEVTYDPVADVRAVVMELFDAMRDYVEQILFT